MTGFLHWTDEWESLDIDEEVLLACRFGATDKLTVFTARRHLMTDARREDVYLPVRARPRDGRAISTWMAWQSTYDGREIGKPFEPHLFARFNPPPARGPLREED